MKANMDFKDSSPCCISKVVGGIRYTLFSESETVQLNCKDNCIYKNSEGKLFCFSSGPLQWYCDSCNFSSSPSKEYICPTTPECPECTCSTVTQECICPSSPPEAYSTNSCPPAQECICPSCPSKSEANSPSATECYCPTLPFNNDTSTIEVTTENPPVSFSENFKWSL